MGRAGRLSRGLIGLLFLAGCATAPITGRSQLRLISTGDEARLGAQAYQQLVSKATAQGKAIRPRDGNPTHEAWHAQIETILGRLIPAADPGRRYRWEYLLLDAPKTVNAAALPGGKIIVWSGIFTVTRDEAGLAVVLGHEAGHVLAHHAAERISQQELTGVATAVLAAGLGGQQGEGLLQAALGLGSEVGILLPYSRLQESEADHIGLLLMAKAGYDPRQAIGLWERMGALGGSRPPEFLSDHPNPEHRRADLIRWMPQALQYYENPSLPLPGIQ